jgi:hypothetical protein
MAIKEELALIAKRNRGMISPDKVVAFAKNKKTALHHSFQWDDRKAGDQYRLWQARQIIRVHVAVIKDDTKPVRAYVSLQQDRGAKGYRRTVDVLASDELREMMLDEAKATMQLFANKYRTIKELSPVIHAIDSLLDSKPPRNGKKKPARKRSLTAGV